jgi:hypothetical protein
MKRVPIILAGVAAILLTLCFLEYGFRGLNPDVESDWVLHPAWWQSDFLADGGLYLRLCAAMVSSPLERFFGENLQVFFDFCILLQLLIIAVLSFIVFYVTRLLLHLSGLSPMNTVK